MYHNGDRKINPVYWAGKWDKSVCKYCTYCIYCTVINLFVSTACTVRFIKRSHLSNQLVVFYKLCVSLQSEKFCSKTIFFKDSENDVCTQGLLWRQFNFTYFLFPLFCISSTYSLDNKRHQHCFKWCGKKNVIAFLTFKVEVSQVVERFIFWRNRLAILEFERLKV